jgi:hypothetical protein
LGAALQRVIHFDDDIDLLPKGAIAPPVLLTA